MEYHTEIESAATRTVIVRTQVLNVDKLEEIGRKICLFTQTNQLINS